MSEIRTRRLLSGDTELARQMFEMMAAVFEEEAELLSVDYIERLLVREDFWAIGAFVGDDVVGGLTAHTLPMTRAEGSEIFIYDVAVRKDRQRRGVGRQLIAALCEAAARIGIQDLFVPADDDDTHALDFYRALGGAPSRVTIFSFLAKSVR